ncbi:hypothetical protein OHT76_26590 [Streptomyces sp. NBC_00287]|uniref:hypothetical protein n=1 Tax=Streptomyces sp. NBC_00287 TaxID=2975702 RepID=UPI002E2C1EBE|nr:hypothetical protein [Streptomyces sp. NBC_00287]
MRAIAAPFTVTAPAGARIRDRLKDLTAADVKVLTLVGEHLGRHQRADLAARVRIGNVPATDTGRTGRKKRLTAVSSSRWAGAMTRASEDQYQLSMRCLIDERAGLRRRIRKIGQRLAVPCGQKRGRVRGYADRNERWQKQRQLNNLEARLAIVDRRIEQGRPRIVVGGCRLARIRHHLAYAGLTEADWREQWDAARLFLTADGESGAPHGNYTITVHPETGEVSLVLPEPLRHLANVPRGRYRLSCTITFHHRRQEWLDRVEAHRAVRYDIVRDPARGRWYLDASWSAATTALSSPHEIRASGGKLLAVDLNADHLAAFVVDAHGNPVGEPHTIPLELTGPTATRDGRLRQAITELICIVKDHGCAGLVVENLGFEDALATGRETMGRGRRGKAFRRTVAGIPTARFRERLRGMAFHQGLVVIAADPAYTSVWGERYWNASLQQQSKTPVTRHHSAAVAIGRRGLGHRARRRPGVTAPHQRMGMRRATGQTMPAPRPRGIASPPRTASAPNAGGETRLCRGDQLALFPGPQDRSEGHRITDPVTANWPVPANNARNGETQPSDRRELFSSAGA